MEILLQGSPLLASHVLSSEIACGPDTRFPIKLKLKKRVHRLKGKTLEKTLRANTKGDASLQGLDRENRDYNSQLQLTILVDTVIHAAPGPDRSSRSCRPDQPAGTGKRKKWLNKCNSTLSTFNIISAYWVDPSSVSSSQHEHS